MQTVVKAPSEFLGAEVPAPWGLKVIIQDDNLTYLAWNATTHEALVVDPVRADLPVLQAECAALKGYRFLGVLDTHTHADHISGATELARHLQVPLLMHVRSACSRVDIRICRDTTFPTQAGALRFLDTPGHTPDHLTAVWGPFLFTGDHILFADTGRDDLPGGDAAAHFDSLQKVKAVARPDHLFLPGHGVKGSTWAKQLEVNAALTQNRETFVPEAAAYTGPAPKQLKESLFENLK